MQRFCKPSGNLREFESHLQHHNMKLSKSESGKLGALKSKETCAAEKIERIENLKKGLDTQSQEEVDRIINSV